MKRGKMMVWRWPVTIGIITLAGLLFALVGDGSWDWISAVLLVVPVILCGLFAFSWRRPDRQPRK